MSQPELIAELLAKDPIDLAASLKRKGHTVASVGRLAKVSRSQASQAFNHGFAVFCVIAEILNEIEAE